jgi:hypothetical protein
VGSTSGSYYELDRGLTHTRVNGTDLNNTATLDSTTAEIR